MYPSLVGRHLKNRVLRKRTSVALACISLLVGCDSGFVRDAKVRVAAKLRDPESAQFREVREIKKSETREAAICGEVNAKNGYGGYVGFKKFYAAEDKVDIESDPQKTSFDRNYEWYCFGIK